MITKGFKKLIDKGHIRLYDSPDSADKVMVNDGLSYTIPWDINFKKGSMSTPARRCKCVWPRRGHGPAFQPVP